MCSTLRPRSSRSTRSPFSVNSFAAHPPEIPDPTTIASYSDDCIVSSLVVLHEPTHPTGFRMTAQWRSIHREGRGERRGESPGSRFRALEFCHPEERSDEG